MPWRVRLGFGPGNAFFGPSEPRAPRRTVVLPFLFLRGSDVMSISRLVGFVFLGIFAYLGVTMFPDLMRYIKISRM
jgi:hypothetical protein